MFIYGRHITVTYVNNCFVRYAVNKLDLNLPFSKHMKELLVMSSGTPSAWNIEHRDELFIYVLTRVGSIVYEYWPETTE